MPYQIFYAIVLGHFRQGRKMISESLFDRSKTNLVLTTNEKLSCHQKKMHAFGIFPLGQHHPQHWENISGKTNLVQTPIKLSYITRSFSVWSKGAYRPSTVEKPKYTSSCFIVYSSLVVYSTKCFSTVDGL